jgi:hypothetical protein
MRLGLAALGRAAFRKKFSAVVSFSLHFAPEGAKAVRKQAARTGPHSPPNFTTRREIP